METYTASTYGDRIAGVYDERHDTFDEAAVLLLPGLRLRERRGGWQREPYTGSGKHVPVYERDV